MNMIYNSPNYCVVEFKGDATRSAPRFTGGFEIMDKLSRREIFLDGDLADKFRENVQELIENEPSIEEVDEFLRQFEGLMQQPLVLH